MMSPSPDSPDTVSGLAPILSASHLISAHPCIFHHTPPCLCQQLMEMFKSAQLLHLDCIYANTF